MSSEEQEYRRRLEIKEKKRKQRIKQQLILLGAIVLFAVLLVVSIVMIVRAVRDSDPLTPASKPADSSVSSGAALPAVAWPVAKDPTAWNLLLVNNSVPMADGFEPELAVVTDAGHQFDARAADALKQMVADCNTVEGHSLAIYSAYRGEQTQNQRYNALVEEYKADGHSDEEADQMARQVEPPYGNSDHQTGLAVDFITDKVPYTGDDFANTNEYLWLMANAQNYGFILRFPESKVNITGINPQPFHFRYVGEEDAKIIQNAGICLEEYLTKMSSTGAASPASGAASAADSSPSSGSAAEES